MTIRTSLVEKLGGKCERCGYVGDPRVLHICLIGEDLKEQRAKSSREAYYMYLLLNNMRDKIELLCLNCKFEKMYATRDKLQKAKVFVWRTSLDLKTLRGAQPEWLASHVSDGERVYVLHSRLGVLEYPALVQVAGVWDEAVMGKLPKGAFGYVEGL